MWFQVELPQETTVTALQLDSTPSPEDFPRGYKVSLSRDGKTWGEPAATGKGELPVTAIQFKPAKTKYIRITETGSVSDRYWSIHELGIYEPGSTLAAKKTTVKPKVSYE